MFCDASSRWERWLVLSPKTKGAARAAAPAAQSASVLLFLFEPPALPLPQPPPNQARDKDGRVTVALCSQVFSIAALGRNSTSPHTAAALPSLLLCSSFVHPPTPR
ncbi:hypothetical protein Q5P01_005557 [Channa striata]|uniref:Uncharacterized protein n=1 Tax=Channa striata TaxID=64152 RepID=A0AA88NGN7_CHASR|nr:hypothetical protein Q5P01_005557 [Channa striata]